MNARRRNALQRWRKMIRPRFKSYGESATFTVSPGTILIQCFRIFPDSVARMRCPFCNSILNVVLGSASFTTPSTSIASSFATVPPLRTRIKKIREFSNENAKLNWTALLQTFNLTLFLFRFGRILFSMYKISALVNTGADSLYGVHRLWIKNFLKV